MHYVCTIYALYMHYLCTMYALCSHYVCTIYAMCTMHALCLHFVSTLYARCKHVVWTMHFVCTMHTKHSLWAVYALCLLFVCTIHCALRIMYTYNNKPRECANFYIKSALLKIFSSNIPLLKAIFWSFSTQEQCGKLLHSCRNGLHTLFGYESWDSASAFSHASLFMHALPWFLLSGPSWYQAVPQYRNSTDIKT